MINRRYVLKILLGFFVSIFMPTKGITNNSSPYHHLPDGTFRNLPGLYYKENIQKRSRANFFKMFYRGIIKKELFGRKEIPDNIPKNHFISQDNALKLFYSNKDPITVTWLGHSSFLIKIKNKIILTDPYLSKIAGEYGFGPSRYVEPGIILKEIPKVDIILISHNHYDHLDTKTLFNLSGKKNIQVLCPLKLSYIIKNLGYEKVNELDWHESFFIDSIEITSLPAYHWSRRLGQKRNQSLWCGYLIKENYNKIYFAGDTAFGTMFDDIGRTYGPVDLSLLPIGAYLPRDIMQSSHCTPEEAVKIAKMMKSKNIIGMHWGTIRLSAEDPWEPPSSFFNAAIKANFKEDAIWKLAIGETRSLKVK